jgi:hypothetical protein
MLLDNYWHVHWHSLCMILDYRSGVNNLFALLGCYATLVRSYWGFRDNLAIFYCRADHEKSIAVLCHFRSCLFLLVNDQQFTCSWHHVRRYVTDHNMPPAVSEDEKGETEPVFFFLFGDWLWAVELEQGIWSESCRKWDCTKDGGLHPHVNECKLKAGWISLQFDRTHHEAQSRAVESLRAECVKLARRLWYTDGFVFGALPSRCVTEHVN